MKKLTDVTYTHTYKHTHIHIISNPSIAAGTQVKHSSLSPAVNMCPEVCTTPDTLRHTAHTIIHNAEALAALQ
jgi:hypothetical protein